VIAALWLLGAAAILASFLRAWSHLAGVARRATPLDVGRWRARAAHAAREVGLDVGRVILRRATEAVTPLTWGAVRPVVILPPSAEGWTGEQARTVLVHELSHIRRHDCLTQTLASLACVLHWFNPLAWLAARRMLTERERACDDQVLLAGAKASDYANDLLEIARSLGAPWSTSQVSTAMARRSQIAGRLLAVLDPHLARGGTSRGRVILAASLGLALLLPLAVVRAAPSGAGVPGPTTVVVSPSPGPIDLLRVRRELEDRHQRLEMALRRGDTEALALHYTADAEVVVPLLPVARGRGGVRDLYEHLVSAGVSAVDHEILDLYPVGGLVCEIAITRFRASSGAVVQSSRDMTLWRQEDGEWRVHREVSVPRGGEEKR
jgi:ketosteroid isomerase-like protein